MLRTKSSARAARAAAASTHYIPYVMDRKLGAPDADGAYDAATQTWSRTFGSAAAKVTFDVATNTGTIQWAD